MKLVTVAEMRSVEKEADANGLSYSEMMEHAGRGLGRWVNAAYPAKGNALGLVGPGNNGGDTLVALAELQATGWSSTACLVRPRSSDDPLVAGLLAAGGSVLTLDLGTDPDSLQAALAAANVILDGVLGTGTRLPLKGDLAKFLGRVKAIIEGLGRHLPVVAVDCPSGVDCDTGEADPECLPADATICMAAVKAGLLRLPAFELVGRLEVVDIGLPAGLPAWEQIQHFVVDSTMVRSILPPRRMDAHKGTFGTALVVTGSINYTGAALLAGKAAYRIGTGLVTMGVISPLHGALAGHFPEATWLLLPHDMGVLAPAAAEIVQQNLERATVLLLGPGWGSEEPTFNFLSRLIKGSSQVNRPGDVGFLHPAEPRKPVEVKPLPPLVIDADGLRLLARLPDWSRLLPAMAVLTPHPGEMSALTGRPTAEIQADRLAIASQYAQDWGHVVVLKGAFTVIAAPDRRLAVIPVATPALARAGTGDVLAGLIAGLRAQGVQPFEAAAAGAWIHAQAGLLAADQLGGSASVLAGDVLNSVPAVLANLLKPDQRL